MPVSSDVITVEIVMFFGLGFLLAILLMLAFMPAVHRRAVRLTKRKYEPVPLEQKEMHAEKDRLRADFAMSTRKLENEIDKMQRQAAAHFIDIARKSESITQLKETLDARDTLIAQLQKRNPRTAATGSGDDSELHALKIDAAAKTAALQAADQRIVALMAEVDSLTAALQRRVQVYDSQQHEIMALTSQNDALRKELAALAQPAQRHPLSMPSPALVPASHLADIRVPDAEEDGDVIRRALEAIQASGANGHSNGWTSSHGAVPFGH
jgi:hypothetical protein